MGAIFYREVSDGVKPYLTLAGEELVRPLAIGSNWTSLKVVMLCAVTTNGTDPISGVTFQMGVISGTSATMGSGNCLKGITAYAPNRTFTLGSGYYSLSSNPYVATVTEGVYTLPGGSTAYTMGPVGRRYLFGIGIVKGSPNWTTYAYFPAAAYYDRDWKAEVVFDFMDYAQVAGASSSIMYSGGVRYDVSGGSSTHTFNETLGSLNTLNIWWNKAQFPLEIYGIWASKLA